MTLDRQYFLPASSFTSSCLRQQPTKKTIWRLDKFFCKEDFNLKNLDFWESFELVGYQQNCSNQKINIWESFDKVSFESGVWRKWTHKKVVHTKSFLVKNKNRNFSVTSVELSHSLRLWLYGFSLLLWHIKPSYWLAKLLFKSSYCQPVHSQVPQLTWKSTRTRG